jgi:hypothetical protein
MQIDVSNGGREIENKDVKCITYLEHYLVKLIINKCIFTLLCKHHIHAIPDSSSS